MWSIIKTLMDHGVEVEMINSDYKNIDHLQHAMEHDISLSQRLNAIKDKTKVIIQEVQLKVETNHDYIIGEFEPDNY